MEKGKFGFRLALYGVAAFVFAFLDYLVPLCLLLAFVLLAEKNEWATKQVMQATVLYVVGAFVSSAVGLLSFINLIPILSSVWRTGYSLLNSVVGIFVAVFCIIGALNNSKGKEANIPVVSSFVNWAYGIVAVKPVQPQPQYQQQYQQPVQPQYQQPVQQQYQQPAQPQYQQPVQQQNNQQ